MMERIINTAICPRVMLSSGQKRNGADAHPSVIPRARRKPIASKNVYESGTSANVSVAARCVTVKGVKNAAGVSGNAMKSSLREAPDVFAATLNLGVFGTLGSVTQSR